MTVAVASFVTVLALVGATPAKGQIHSAGVIAFERVVGTSSDVYSLDPDGGSLRRLTTWQRSDFAPSWSSKGQIAFVSDRSGSFELFTMTASGRRQRQLTKSGTPLNKNRPDWAPDGSRIAFAAGPARRADIWIFTPSTRKLVNVTRSATDDDGSPSWSPDGEQLVFSSNRHGRQNLYRYLRTSRRILRLTRGTSDDFDPAWAPDGRQVAFTRRGRDGNYDIYVIDVQTGAEHRLTSGSAQDRDPTWSSDSALIAFVTNRDAADDYEIYVMGADGANPVNITRSPKTLDLAPDWSDSTVSPRRIQVRSPQAAAQTCDVVGTAHADMLVGNGSDQVLCGKEGDDTIKAGGGRDDVRGGPGKDTIWGQGADDLLQGGDGKDKLHGGPGADIFYPGAGEDEVDGGKSKLDRCDYCDSSDSVKSVEVVGGG